MKVKNFNQYLNENNTETFLLYHGTSSGNLDSIKSKPTNLFVTTDKDVAFYYAAKGGEKYFMDKEFEFENEYGVTPDEYFDTEENGEIPMFKSLYPKNESPVVIEFKIPKYKIDNINNYIGYKGGEILIIPEYINQIIPVNWDDLNF